MTAAREFVDYWFTNSVAPTSSYPLGADARAMQRHPSNSSTTFEERLVDLARRVRADVEALPRFKKRDDLVQQLREIETSVELRRYQ